MADSKITTLQGPTAKAEQAAAAAPNVVTGANSDDQLSGAKKTITIHASEAINGSEPVDVSLNGYLYRIPRNTPSEVPVEVVEILKNAVQTSFHAVPGGGHEPRNTPRFAYSVE